MGGGSNSFASIFMNIFQIEHLHIGLLYICNIYILLTASSLGGGVAKIWQSDVCWDICAFKLFTTLSSHVQIFAQTYLCSTGYFPKYLELEVQGHFCPHGICVWNWSMIVIAISMLIVMAITKFVKYKSSSSSSSSLSLSSSSSSLLSSPSASPYCSEIQSDQSSLLRRSNLPYEKVWASPPSSLLLMVSNFFCWDLSFTIYHCYNDFLMKRCERVLHPPP